jgi:hypothetical protein
MFDELDAGLQRLVTDRNAPQPLREADVSFETPSRDYAPGRPTLNLFLHQVQEHRALRDPAPVIDRSGPEIMRREQPLRVACGYLVTAWSDLAAGSAVRVAQEHRLLGLALAWLSRFGSIPAAYLHGAFADQPFPPPTVVARPQLPEEPGQFWTALGVLPRPAFGLVVTVALDLGVATSLGPPVVSTEIRLAARDGPQPTAGQPLRP